MEPKYSSLAYLVGGAFLSAIAIFIFAWPVQAVQPEKLTQSIEDLAVAVTNLDQKIGHLHDSIPYQVAPVVGGVVRSPLNNSAAENLSARLESLEETIRAMTNSLGGGRKKAIEGDGREAPYYVESFPSNTEALLNLKLHSNRQLSIGFLGWSYRDILNEFGSPAEVYNSGNGGVQFNYGELPSGGFVGVAFEDGHVVGIQSDWDE